MTEVGLARNGRNVEKEGHFGASEAARTRGGKTTGLPLMADQQPGKFKTSGADAEKPAGDEAPAEAPAEAAKEGA